MCLSLTDSLLNLQNLFAWLNGFVSTFNCWFFNFLWSTAVSCRTMFLLTLSICQYLVLVKLLNKHKDYIKEVYFFFSEHAGQHDEYLQWSRRLWQRRGERRHSLLFELWWKRPEPPGPHHGVPRAGLRRYLSAALQPVTIKHTHFDSLILRFTEKSLQ